MLEPAAIRRERPVRQVSAANRVLVNQFPDCRFGRGVVMLRWAAIFFVIAIVAAILGFSGIAAGAAEIAKILFFVFLLVFVVTLIIAVMRK